jgi:hypothetical protein
MSDDPKSNHGIGADRPPAPSEGAGEAFDLPRPDVTSRLTGPADRRPAGADRPIRPLHVRVNAMRVEASRQRAQAARLLAESLAHARRALAVVEAVEADAIVDEALEASAGRLIASALDRVRADLANATQADALLTTACDAEAGALLAISAAFPARPARA